MITDIARIDQRIRDIEERRNPPSNDEDGHVGESCS
jgi:hypothetical protein